MADVNSNININFNTAAALAQLRSLQAGLSKFHQSLAEGNLAATNAQKGLNAQLLQAVGATGKFSASQVKVAGSTLAFTSALEKNKLSLREYYRYTMAAATANTRIMGKAFAQEREIINRARRDRVKALQSQYIQMNKSNAGFMDAIKVMPKSLAMANGKFTELGTRIQYAAQRQQFLNQLLKQGSTQLLNFGKNTQWAGRQLMVGLTMPLALFGSAAAKAFRELETEIVKFKRVYGDAFTNDAETSAAVENIKKLANEYTKYGVSVKKTVEMAGTAAAAGFTGSGLTTQVETATKLAVLGQVEQQQALETTISLQNAFGLSSDELAKKIDFLNAVENQTVLSIEDLTIAIPKAAPVIKQLGGNVEDLAFFLTAMKEGGINASEGANALKSGLASLINPSKKAAEMLGGLGINIKGIVENNKGDIKATVVGFARALDTLDPLNRARAIEQMFGKFQFARLSTLFQNVTKDGSQASRAFDLAGKSVEELAILSEREMKKIEDSVGVKFQAAVEQFKQDIMPLGKIFLEALTPIVKFFGGLFEKFNGLGDNTKKVIAIIVGAVAGLGPIVLMTFGLLANGIANVVKFFAMLRGGIAKLNGQTNILGGGFNYVTQEQIENAASSQQLHQTHTKLIEVFNVEKTSVMQLVGAYNSLSSQMRTMASQNPALFAGGAAGAKRAVSKMPPVRKFEEGVLSVPGPKGAGDVVPAMLSPGEAVIPTDTTNKYRGLISAMFKDKVPGFMAGRLPGGPGRGIPLSAGPAAVRKAQQATYRRRDDARQGYNEPHPERKSGPTFIGMPKSAQEASQSRQIVDKISNSVKSGRFGDVPPTDFGVQLQPFSGRSFPVRGVGGVYRKPNGQVVVVKPTMDEKTALAEVRATQIAREVHGLVSPKQTIKTMIDPTDPSGQRKFIVIESPYDPRIAAMDGKFSKSDMVKQLVASTLRADKDLQQANLSGNVLADVGTAGVFDRASGFRDFSKGLPSMEEQAVVNLLGVKGGAKKFFAQETSGIAATMTPAQYDAAIKGEINKSIPRLEKVVKSWDLTPDEQVVYGDMLKRLKAGAKTDWSKLQPVHARAGEGVVKAEEGIGSGAKNSIVQEQIKKYTLASGSQEQNMVAKLKENAHNTLIEKLKDLEKADPNRAAAIKTAWEGGLAKLPPSGKEKRFDSRQTKFLDEISKMTPIKVDGEIKYLSKDDMDSFAKDPAHRAKYARTKQQVIDNVLYRMGVIPNEKGVLVDKGGFEGRFGNPTEFAKDLRSSNKAAGGGIGMTSKVVRPFAREEIAAYNARVGNPLKTKTGMAMLAEGYSQEQIRDALRQNLSHIKQEVTGSTSGAEKMKTGEALYDADIVNKYMNAKDRSSNILNDFNKDNILGLSEVEKSEYKKAAEFMAKGEHPKNAQERALLAKAVELDQKVINHKNKGNIVSGKFLPADLKIPKILNTLFSDPAFQPGRLINLAAKSADEVFVGVKRGESLFNEDLTKEEKINSSNSSPMKKDTIAVNKKGKRTKDNAVIKKKKRQVVKTPAQSARVRVIKGHEDGTELTPYQRQELKKIKSKYPKLDEKQSMDVLRRKLKADQKIIKAKEDEGAEARKAARRAEQLPKQEAANQAKLNKIEKERQSRLLEASKHQDQANKMNAKMDKKEATQKARIARQEKVGRYSGGASMALGTAGMGLMMAGQEKAGMAVMGASAVAGMAPMLTNPYVAAGAAVVALAGGLWMLDRSAKQAAESQSKMVDATYATTEKMKAIGELTGRVGASEIMAKKRSESVSDRYTTGFERGKQQFGATFLENAAGKDIMAQFVENMKSGTDKAARQMALQLSGYVSDGVMTAEEAHSVASQIGINLNNQTLSSQISGNLLELIGPSGEDLLISPLEVRVKLINEQKALSDDFRTQLEQWKSGNLKNSDASKFAAAGAAAGAQNLEFNQAQIDSLNVQYDKELKILEAQKAATTDKAKQAEIDGKITDLEAKRLKGTDTLRSSAKKMLDDQIKLYRATQGGIGDGKQLVQDAFFDSLKKQVKTKYENDPQSAFVDQFLGASAKFKSEELEVKINTIVASGQMKPATATSLMEMFAGNEGGLTKFLNATTKLQDPGKVAELINALGGIKKKGVAKKIVADIAARKPKDADKLMATIMLMQKMSRREINITAFFEQEDAMTKLQDLQKELEAVETMPTPITKKAITELDTNGDGTVEDMSALLAVWDKWGNLPDETKKTVIQEYVTVLRTLTEGDIDAEIKKRVAAAGGAGTVADYYATEAGRNAAATGVAAERAMQATKQDIASNAAGKVKDTSTGSKDNPLSFLDNLAMRLKQVRDNAFNALKPVDSLLAAFKDKKTQQNAFKLFDGIQNRLLKMGVGKDLRDAIASMSAEDFAKVAALKGKNALFTFQKGKARSKDTITGLTDTGKSVDQGYREANLGDFNLVNEETIKNIQDQNTAYKILISNGLTAAQALEIVADQGQAAAIAGGAIKTSDPEWKKYIANIKTANSALERQAVLNQAIKANEDFKMYQEMPKLVTQMKDLGYSTDQIEAVLGDPQLAKFLVEDLADGKLDAKAIAEYLNNIEAKKIIDIQVKLNQGDLAGAAEKGRQIVDELFAAQEALIRTGPEAMQIKGNESQIRDLEGQIAPFQRQVNALNDKIQDGQRAIEENYTRPIEKLSEDVNDLNRELEVNPLFGDRAIKKIQDENNMLSNDLNVINHAAEEVNKQYDAQAEALSKVQEINANIMEQQKEQLDLADALTQGDISAAARAAQGMRQTAASQFASGQSAALEQARQNALGGLVGPQSGLTSEQISEKQYQNSQKIYQMETDPRRLEIVNQIQIKQDEIYNLEEKREDALLKIRDLEDQIYNIERNSIKPLQDRIDALNYENAALQRSIDKQIENLKVLGKTRAEWDAINAKLDYAAAVKKAMENSADLAGLLAAAEALNLTWADILAKMAEYANGVPAPVGAAKGAFDGTGSYVPPAETPESKAAAAEFDALVATVDDLLARIEDATQNGEYFRLANLNAQLAAAQKAYDDFVNKDLDPNGTSGGGGIGGRYGIQALASGGMVKPKYFSFGGFARGSDTVPAMLTPGEFIMSKYAVQSHGIDKMQAMNNGSSVGDSVYNYSISVNVKSDANPDEIARAVMTQIKSVDSQKIRGTRL